MKRQNIYVWIFVGGLLFILIITFQIFFVRVNLSSESFPLREKWSVGINGGIEGISISDEHNILVRTSRNLYALEEKNGMVLWQKELAWQGVSSPAIGRNSQVYVGDGKGIWALNLLDGSVIWNYLTGAEAKVLQVTDNFVVAESLVDLFLIDSANGSLLWRTHACHGDFQSYIFEENVYIPCEGHGLRALDIDSGEDVWEIEQQGAFDQVAFDNGVIYYDLSARSINALDLEKVKELWVSSVFHTGITQFEVENNLLLLADSNQLCVFAAENGRLLWCAEHNAPLNPTIMDNYIYTFDGSQNIISALDVASGNEVGKLTLKKFDIIGVQRNLMETTGDLLIFGINDELFAYSQ